MHPFNARLAARPAGGPRDLGRRRSRAWSRCGSSRAGWPRLMHPLIVLLAVPAHRCFGGRSRRRTPDDVLALLALLFLLRCLLDPVNNAYYHVPFLLSLVAWEGLTRRGPPVVSLLSSAADLLHDLQGGLDRRPRGPQRALPARDATRSACGSASVSTRRHPCCAGAHGPRPSSGHTPPASSQVILRACRLRESVMRCGPWPRSWTNTICSPTPSAP